MNLKDSFVINAPVETVWAFLHDIPRVSACMPGAESVQEVEPDVYRGKLQARVGAVKAAFEGEATIEERVEPEKLSASFKAQDRKLATNVTGSFTAQLSSVEAGTQIEYEMDFAMRGRLATLGFSVVQQTAKKMTAEFAQRLRDELTEADTDPSVDKT